MSDCCSTVRLKRCDLTEDSIEAAFQVEFRNLSELTRAQTDLRSKVAPFVISVIHGEGIS